MKPGRIDQRFMDFALSLAMRGASSASPNPRVGCVIVRNQRVVAYGWHEGPGKPHAEAAAIAMAGDLARGAVLYVNLEPCIHFGRTPPCAPRIIKAGVSRVVIGVEDPDPRVTGGGVAMLENAGVSVDVGVRKAECRWINRGFFSRIENGRPWVTLKAAISLDGCIAPSDGNSKWITNVFSRRLAHMLRAENDAVMIGARTAKIDDPHLDVRLCPGDSPLRVVLDSRFRAPVDLAVFRDDNVLAIGLNQAEKEVETEDMARRGRHVLVEPDAGGKPSMSEILQKLGAMGINYLLAEGGAGVAASLLKDDLVDQFSFFQASKFLGDGVGIGSALPGAAMEQAIHAEVACVRSVEEDKWLEGGRACSPDSLNR
ncbi:MAG: bifunctional diaminohydroxyphosphoribosylaminopyrimidine deaminase/5-amino-6-(5-phosphoribosylamino)uracil reductase RibD [Synergistota bacterium]|nr:bifunctional diaminohydroxyphosphoribosylaminopyrimidine deaminase/5-amino-6-(5-phosphoribosylamino)uracil reductase RibD [Synergistota bacterium]